ncbi:MAG: leucyl/phenylalanyl-tRNA--protein transferase [Rubrivivax sp.]
MAEPTPALLWIDDDTPFPPTSLAWGDDSDAPGLLAAGGGLGTQRLEQAYRQGIFPWFAPGQPVLWWSPDPRMVLPVDQFRVSKTFVKTLRRFVRSSGHRIRIDTDFDAVIAACAGTPRAGQDGTWIVAQMVQAYRAWHRAGQVHSVETWVDGQLVGGLYCVAIGRMVFGESMFAWRSDASKIALAALVCFCRHHGVSLIDCQQDTVHLASMGAGPIARGDFETHLSRTLGAPAIADWTYDESHWAQLAVLARSLCDDPHDESL